MNIVARIREETKAYCKENAIIEEWRNYTDE